MFLKEVAAFINQHIAEHPEHADLEVKFGFWPTSTPEEEPSLEVEVVKYLKVKIRVYKFGYQIAHERKQFLNNERQHGKRK